MAVFDAGSHIGTTFASQEDFAGHTGRFARQGLRAGAKVIVFPADPHGPAARLLSAGPEVAAAIRSGQMAIGDSKTLQLAAGRFDRDYLHHVCQPATRMAVAEGFTGLWVGADMAWAAPHLSDISALTELEAGAFPLFASRQLTALCLYDVNVFEPRQAIQACQAHPLAISGSGFSYEPLNCGLGVRLSGETDLANQHAFTALVNSLAPASTIDITAMSFIGAHALGDLARITAALPGITVTATAFQASLLTMVGVGEASITLTQETPRDGEAVPITGT